MQVTFRGRNVKNVYVYIITGGGGREGNHSVLFPRPIRIYHQWPIYILQHEAYQMYVCENCPFSR